MESKNLINQIIVDIKELNDLLEEFNILTNDVLRISDNSYFKDEVLDLVKQNEDLYLNLQGLNSLI